MLGLKASGVSPYIWEEYDMKVLHQTMGKTIRFLHIYQNIVIGVLVIAASVFMLTAAGKIKVIASSLTAIDNAAFLPQVVFGVLIFIGLLLILFGWKQISAKRATVLEGEVLEQKANETLRSLGSLAMLFVYIFCFNRLGFVFSSVLYTTTMMMYMTKKEDRRPILFAVISVIMTLVVYFCFQQFLYIYLPNGILEGVF